MTHSRDAGGPNGGEPEDGELESGSRLGAEPQAAAPLNALLEDDDGSPLLPLLDAEAGPARPLAERELLLLADRIERQFAQRRRPLSRLTPRRLLLAGGLFAASAAAAVAGVNVLRHSANPTPATSLPAVAEAPPAPPSAAEPSVVSPLPEPAEPAPATAPSLGTEERPAEPGDSKEPGAVPKSSDSSPPALPSSRNGATGRPGSHPSAAPSGTVASDRLAAANSLRSRHRYREALALYLQVIEIAPNGMQASVARVAAAEMRLEQFGDLAGAEHLYREARTQGGELTAEAQFGLAQVARARGDESGERRALQDFLSRHPESPLGAAARRRLNTLGAR